MKLPSNKGLTLVEVLIAVVVSSIVMAAMFFTYDIFQKSYKGIVDRSVISQNSRNAISMMIRDLRMTGYQDFNTKWSNLPSSIIIHSDNSNGPDSIEIIYDENKNDRIKIAYKLEKEKSTDNYYFLAKARYGWNGSIWTTAVAGGYAYEKVADYFEDLQFSLKNSSGNKTSQSSSTNYIEIYAILKSPNEIHKQPVAQNFTSDNRTIVVTDKYLREDFFVSVYPRNIIKN